MALQSSPSSSSDRVKYNVFLSFRGFDTRTGFIGYLYKALSDRGIFTFIDDRELEGGEEITPALLKAIEDSMIAIIVFSKNYAESSFCLDELVHIIECSKAKDRLVLPVFYGVEPTHLRQNTGSYGEAMAKHEAKFRYNKETCIHNMERLQKWKAALEKAANLSGHHFNFDRKEYEYKFIEKIVDFVSKKINRIPLYVQDCRVALKPRVLQVKSLLNVESDDGVCMVGIHGMGGIGKTTLAKEIYNSIAYQFEEVCFLDDVRDGGLLHIQETLLHRTIREKDLKLGSVGNGMSVIKQRLHTKKVLLILDDVDDLKQLEALVGSRDWFGPGSRIIITTRDLHLLKRFGIEKTYLVEELNKGEALELLSWKAFGNNNVDPSYEDILNRAFTCASGLPLALEVVGSNLFRKKIEEWKPILDRYKRNPCKDIRKTLRASFDALEKDEQCVFLDIACCFSGSKLEDVERILCAHHGYCIKYLIKVLVEKSLIKITHWGYVELHDLIEDMGKNIVQQESPKEPGEQSRLWSQKDIITVLEDNTGTSNIEIIFLDSHSACTVDWNGEAFKKMRNLKTLIINNNNNNYIFSRDIIRFSEDPKIFPSSLRVLELARYPTSKFIPSIFSSKKFENMSILKSDYNNYLTNIPDVSGLPNLEILSFICCDSLATIHESVGFLSKLKILNVESCRKLRIFPPIIKLTSLQVLILSCCKSLESFPEISGEMKNITQLDLNVTSIKEWPSSFQNFTGLCKLTIERAKLPISILYIQKLSVMDAFDCQLLPMQNDNLNPIESSNVKFLYLKNCNLTDEILSLVIKLVTNVVEFDLNGSNFTTIPESINGCHSLRKLNLDDCKCLRDIRGIPPNLKYLSAFGCELLNSSSCGSLLMNQEVHEKGGTVFCFPCGNSRIPVWFDHQHRVKPSSCRASISFWFRKSLPYVAVYFVCKSAHESERGQSRFNPKVVLTSSRYHEVSLSLYEPYLSNMRCDYMYLLDLELSRILKSELNESLLKNEWIHAEVQLEAIETFGSESDHLMEIGVHVLFKEKTSLDDIRFTYPGNPYKEMERER